MTIDELKALRAADKFHHATYRFDGLWEGLWIYEKAESGFNGYAPAGAFYKNDPHLMDAERIVRGEIHIGAYGNG